jgi:DNA-binding MurR/RpiR family transcriptional regulator
METLNNNNLNNDNSLFFIDVSPEAPETQSTNQFTQYDNLPVYTLTDFFENQKVKELRFFISSYKKKKNPYGSFTIYLYASLERTPPKFVLRTTSQNILNFINQYYKQHKNKPFTCIINYYNKKGKKSLIIQQPQQS